jgi:hypothetical protein
MRFTVRTVMITLNIITLQPGRPKNRLQINLIIYIIRSRHPPQGWEGIERPAGETSATPAAAPGH